jgi:Putative 2OG-Fe(II) oxygenase
MTGKIESHFYFPSPVYTVDKPEFLEIVNKVADEFIKENKQEINELYPVEMTGNMFNDERLFDFCFFTADAARKILDDQGYNINLFYLYFKEMWAQEHHKGSSMDRHIHGDGAKMVGFYFLQTPKDSSRVLFHDCNDSKVITGLPEKDISKVTTASTLINYIPKAGQFMFTNAWLPHSFTKNASDKSFKFIHFNLGAELAPIEQNNVEII